MILEHYRRRCCRQELDKNRSNVNIYDGIKLKRYGECNQTINRYW